MIEQAKVKIESEKNAAMAELKLSTLSLSIAEKLLKDELSNKEAQTKLVEKLGDVKLNNIMASTRAAIVTKAILEIAESKEWL
jgi:hypothetical protein